MCYRLHIPVNKKKIIENVVYEIVDKYMDSRLPTYGARPVADMRF